MNDLRTGQRGVLSRVGLTLRHAVRDVTLIVTSIVIAFMLDAWWSSAQDRRDLAGHLVALEHEFADINSGLNRDRRSIMLATAATHSILL